MKTISKASVAINKLNELKVLAEYIKFTQKSIDLLTDSIEGDAGQLWGDLVPAWKEKLDVKERVLNRIIERYNRKLKELKKYEAGLYRPASFNLHTCQSRHSKEPNMA